MRLPLLYPRPRRGLSICPRRRPLNRRGGKDDIDPRALNAHELDGKEAYRSADVESKQCEEIKLHFFEMHTVAVGYILRKSKRGLLCIVCGEYG